MAAVQPNPFSGGADPNSLGSSITGAAPPMASTIPAAGAGTVGAAGGAMAVGAPVPAGGAAAAGMGMMQLFLYQPSFLIALIGAIFFAIVGMVHLVHLFRTKAWYFGLIAQGALLAAISSAARAVFTLDMRNFKNAIIVFIFTQKALGSITAIGIIFTFTRLFWWIAPNEKRKFSTVWAPPGLVSFTWAGMSVGCDIMKVVGNSVLDPRTTGPRVEGAGNVLQMFVFGGFTIMAVRFHWLATTWEGQGDMPGRPGHWKQMSYAIIGCAALITARQIDQVVVFDQMTVPMSYTLTQEWVFWFFDQLPLLAIYFIFATIHPGYYFPRDYTRLRLNRKRLIAIKGSTDESGMKNGFVISSPRPTGPERYKPDWVQVKEIEVGPYGIAR